MAKSTEPSKAKGLLSHINEQATLKGSINSTINSTLRGANVIATATNDFKKETRLVLQPGRVETFSQAMKRLEINEANLPLIHNQILLQIYLTFLLASFSLIISIYFLVLQNWASALLSLIVSLTCIANFSQSSIRAYQVRHRQLGAASQWFSNPAQWFPSRLKNVVPMQEGDPLRHPVIVNQYVSKAIFFMMTGAVFFGLGVGLYFADFRGVPMAPVALCFFLAAAFNGYGCRFSFEVFRRRKGLYCDILLWLITPEAWVPSKSHRLIRRESKKETPHGL